ncbi:hypothetical protein FB45DRAFT_42030 [Roridomyces roridus]|uniref:Uncharacterized protein n=1 Tax=Roridomyces roridus TaxID=1738132 RepID=A0AAD7BRV6_9AGAR|nr:hypothetical protein FB45DRAFT_42030 [Roridomyces roridus]
MAPLHTQLREAIHESIQCSSPRFSYYLHKRGLKRQIASATRTELEETMVLGEMLLDFCLMEYMFNNGISSQHLSAIKTQLSHPAVSNALLQREPIQFQRYPDDSAVPPVVVKLFVGALTGMMGLSDTNEWFEDALGGAVQAAADVCVHHMQSVFLLPIRSRWLVCMTRLDALTENHARPNDRARNFARLTLAAQALTNSPAEPIDTIPSYEKPVAPTGISGRLGSGSLNASSGRPGGRA